MEKEALSASQRPKFSKKKGKRDASFSFWKGEEGEGVCFRPWNQKKGGKKRPFGGQLVLKGSASSLSRGKKKVFLDDSSVCEGGKDRRTPITPFRSSWKVKGGTDWTQNGYGIEKKKENYG